MIVAALLIAICTSGALAIVAGLVFGASFWICVLIYVLSGGATMILVTGIAALCHMRRDRDAPETVEQEEGEPALAHA